MPGENRWGSALKAFGLSVCISMVALTLLSSSSVSLPAGTASTSDMITVVDQDLLHGHRVYKDTHRDDLMDFVQTSDGVADHATTTVTTTNAGQPRRRPPRLPQRAAPAPDAPAAVTSPPSPQPTPLEALLRRRSGLYAGGANPRPGWARNSERSHAPANATHLPMPCQVSLQGGRGGEEGGDPQLAHFRRLLGARVPQPHQDLRRPRRRVSLPCRRVSTVWTHPPSLAPSLPRSHGFDPPLPSPLQLCW